MKAYISFVLLIPILLTYAYVLQAAHNYDHSRAIAAKMLAEKTWEQKQIIRGYAKEGIRDGILAYKEAAGDEIDPEALAIAVKAAVALKLASIPVEEGLKVGCYYGRPSIEEPIFQLASPQCAELVNVAIDLAEGKVRIWLGNSYLPVNYIAIAGEDRRFGLKTRAYFPPSEKIEVAIG